MTTATGRTLIDVGSRGWYEDPAEPGKKVRKQDGDKIVSREEFEGMVAQASGSNNGDGEAEAAPKPEEPVTISDTGKLLKGKTTVIKCQWRGPDGKDKPCGAERVVKVQDAFQVKHCAVHQKAHRNALKRRKNAERRKQREKAAAKG